VRDVGMVHPQGDDVFQELFLRLWEDDYRRLRNWSGEGDFAGYLVPIVRHLAIDHVRGRRPERENPLPRPDEQDEPSTSEPDAEELAQLEEQFDAIEQALGGLSDRDRELYRLRYLEERPYAEIAVELEITVNHVGVLLSRLTTNLRAAVAAAGDARRAHARPRFTGAETSPGTE
jgi:RNA polymerase sigma-70 factor (ECF subfamily)